MPMICLRADYHLQFHRLTDKRRIRWSPTCMDALPLCMFLRLRIRSVKIMDLPGSTYSVLPLMQITRWGSRSLVGVSGDKGWLKTSKLSFESETSMTSSSSLIVDWDGVASFSAARWNGNATFGMPSRIGLVVRKPRTTTLIWCRRGSFSFI